MRTDDRMPLPAFVGLVLAVLSLEGARAKMGAFGAADGRLLTAVDTCADSDDVYFDAKRNRAYVSCGEGFLQVFAVQGYPCADLGRVATSAGARTSLFVPGIDRLLLAVRANGGTPAGIWVFSPQ